MSAAQRGRIEVRLRELAQLFNSMDPSPFLDRDLDADAEEFIVGWAREHPADHEFDLVIHLAQPPPPDRAAGAEEAVHHYFAQRAEMKARDFRRLLRQGRTTLLVGVVFLVACLLLAGVATRLWPGPPGAIAREGLTIAGWVAMWRPIQIYLYDWWPLRDEIRILQRLARMRVRLIPPSPEKP
jgi:hypothetical protein